MTTWHQKHEQALSTGDRLADAIAAFIGSWYFIVGQALLMAVWATVNTLAFFHTIRFDPYPFVFLNLFMSAEAAFSTPLILKSQNRQGERDRVQALHDYAVNIEAKRMIEALHGLSALHGVKLDKMLQIMEGRRTTPARDGSAQPPSPRASGDGKRTREHLSPHSSR